MDIDLFQAILLGLLAVGLIVLIALLMTLGGIRKALERGASEEATTPASTAAPTPVVAEAEREEPAPVAAAAAVTPAVQETPVQETPAPAVAATPAPAVEDNQAATIRAVLSQHGVDAATQTPAAPAQTPAAAEPASVVAAHIDTDEPEEEPFQRDGRWWFKRGGELLVYNEGTAQWEAAERPAHWPAGGAASTSAIPVASTTSAAVTSPQPAATGAGTGWKCPSCGAINGSTAASCRMCFTARP